MAPFLGATALGLGATLLSTFVGERAATAHYPDIMGCEIECLVVATGWPLVFVRDYLGMSVVNSADILEVWFAADRLDWPPFILNVIFWSLFYLAPRDPHRQSPRRPERFRWLGLAEHCEDETWRRLSPASTTALAAKTIRG